MAKGKYEYWRTEEGILLLEGYAREGLTDDKIADKIGITRSTLSAWKTKYSDISDALKRGKEVVDIQVENALLKRALGYTYVERTKEPVVLYDENGKVIGTELRVTKEVTKEVIPDTTAQIFWLKNRRPDKWRQNPLPEYGDAGESGSLADAISEAWKMREEKQ